jgi:hypothetical protein
MNKLILLKFISPFLGVLLGAGFLFYRIKKGYENFDREIPFFMIVSVLTTGAVIIFLRALFG